MLGTLLSHMQTKTILVIVFAVLLVALVGALAYQKLTQPEATPVAVDQNQQIQDETAGWNTYKNEQYGFEVEYPSKYVASSRVGYFPKNKVVATFAHDNNYFLDVAIFKGLIKDYRFEDPSTGGNFMFNSQNKNWALSNGAKLPEGLFEKIDTNIEAYLYKTGDLLTSHKVIIIPNPANSLVVEIVATTIATQVETANGLDYVATSLDFDIKEMLSTFKFIK